jgi:hypothetical protein
MRRTSQGAWSRSVNYISVLFLEMRKLRHREIKQFSLAKGKGRFDNEQIVYLSHSLYFSCSVEGGMTCPQVKSSLLAPPMSWQFFKFGLMSLWVDLNLTSRSHIIPGCSVPTNNWNSSSPEPVLYDRGGECGEKMVISHMLQGLFSLNESFSV